MALTLPTPTTAREVAADEVIRILEQVQPIHRGVNIASWLQRLLALRTRPGSDLKVLTCACTRILRYLPETNEAKQWAALVVLRSTPDAFITPKVVQQTVHIHMILVTLWDFAMNDFPPTGDQLAAFTRTLARQLLTNPDDRSRLSVNELDAIRAGYRLLRSELDGFA